MKRCTKCILPETYPDIHFDDQGVCNRCAAWEKDFKKIDSTQQRRELDEIIQRKKKEAADCHSPFDVVVPVSGGKDSAYVLYVMKEIYQCEILALNYYNGFQTELAYKNIIHLLQVFDVDFKMLALRPGLLKKAYSLSLQELGEFCLICNCTGYWMAFDFISRYFAPYNYFPLIVGGWSKLYEFDPYINTLNINRYFELITHTGLIDEFKKYLNISILENLLAVADVRQQSTVTFIQLPEYWPWSHSEIIETLKKYGWQSQKDKDTHFDCWASPLADWLETKKYGLNQKTTILSTYARAGLIKRETALANEEKNAAARPESALVERFTSQLNLESQDLKNLFI